MMMIALLLSATACQASWEKEGSNVAASGSGATRTYASTGFNAVDLRGSDDVDIKTGPFAVTAEGDPKVLDELEIQVVDGTLRIGRRSRTGLFVSSDAGARVHVVMPALASATVSGSGDMTAQRAEGDVRASVSGSGNLSIAEVKGGNTKFSVAGSGNLNLRGTVDKLDASIAGSGDIEAGELSANSAEVSIAGSGGLKAVVKGPASVSIIGSGDAELTGGAKCSVSAVGSGEAKCS